MSIVVKGGVLHTTMSCVVRLSTQDLSDLLELPRRHEQREGSPAPRVDELSLRPTGTQEAADGLVLIQ